MSMDLLAAFLKTVGAFQTRHSGRTLGHHLLGTYALLADAGCDEATCLAGGLHSIFGTDRFTTKTCDPVRDGHRIAALFGQRAEFLAGMFGGFERGRTRQIEVGPFDPLLNRALRLLEAANILEQGGSLDRWPRIKAAWEQQLEAANEARSEA